MRTDPGFDREQIRLTLMNSYDIRDVELDFLPLGLDAGAAVYKATNPEGQAWFVKVKIATEVGSGVAIALALNHAGIDSVLGPCPNRLGVPWTESDGKIMMIYPFIDGATAVESGLTDYQWRTFGLALRAVHDAELPHDLIAELPVETFAIPSLDALEQQLIWVETRPTRTIPGLRFVEQMERHRSTITAMAERVRELQASLQSRVIRNVLCHADIHAANILVGTDGRIHLVDWDAPRIAPRERDLLFVIGSRIARDVLPQEEACFFEGYGRVEIDFEALVFFRYERVIEDLFENGKHLLASTNLDDPDTEFALRITDSFFAPGGYIDTIEQVKLPPVT